MSPALSLEKWKIVLSKDTQIARLLNVIDERDFLQEHMSSASLKECIDGGDNNLARVQLMIRSMINDDNESLYNALCAYFLDRSKAYKDMYKLFSGIDPDACNEKSIQLAVLKEKMHQLTEELKYWHVKEQSGERLDMIQKECGDMKNGVHEMKERIGELQKKVENWIESESATFQQLQTSLESVRKVAPSPPFPDPYSDEMRAKVAKRNLSYWKRFTLKLVPFLCAENGEYYVDWNSDDEQWKFGDCGRHHWSPCNYVQCSLLLPRQFNADGLNDRVVNMQVSKRGTSLTMSMTHSYSPSDNVPLTTIKCHFHLTIKFNDGTSSIELREQILCQVNSKESKKVFTSGELPSLSSSNQMAPIMGLTLSPL